ncbi:cupin domain-containing protein [bacterium]|nr:cupin domain-containing protein [bacterium]MBU1984200.1 cupin domain-containing protein [bacterium]
MFVKSLESCKPFVAGDRTILRELLHPLRDPVGIRYSLAHAKLAVGKWSDLHVLTTSEVYYILAGRGTMEIDGAQREVGPGDAVYIPPEARQRILSLGPADIEFLCIVDPAWRAEDETVL